MSTNKTAILSAVEGYLELGMHDEAVRELEKLPDKEASVLRCRILEAAMKILLLASESLVALMQRHLEELREG